MCFSPFALDELGVLTEGSFGEIAGEPNAISG